MLVSIKTYNHASNPNADIVSIKAFISIWKENGISYTGAVCIYSSITSSTISFVLFLLYYKIYTLNQHSFICICTWVIHLRSPPVLHGIPCSASLCQCKLLVLLPDEGWIKSLPARSRVSSSGTAERSSILRHLPSRDSLSPINQVFFCYCYPSPLLWTSLPKLLSLEIRLLHCKCVLEDNDPFFQFL